MTVYAVVQVKIKDREAYDRYSDAFMNVFEKFEGTMLAADFDPKLVEGADLTALLVKGIEVSH